jgi:opacity protein-like surface antigen
MARVYDAKRRLPFAALVTVTAILLSLAAPVAVPAAGPGFGAFTWNKTRLTMTDGYAYLKPDSFDAKKKVTVVALVTVKLDRTKIDDALDRESAIEEQVRDGKGTLVKLTFGADGSFQTLNAQIRTDAGSQSLSTSGGLKAAMKATTAQRVAGRVQTAGAQTFSSDKYSCDFTFDIPVTPEPPPGTPLPAGGGEAGKAYVALVAAIQKGDVDAIARYWPKEKAAEMVAARKEPDFKKGLEMLKMFSPKSVTVKGGSLRGNVADLDVVGKDADGNVMDGKVRMVKDGTSWRQADENLTTHVK